MTDLIVTWYSSLDESQGFVLHWLVALSCIPIVERVIARWPSYSHPLSAPDQLKSQKDEL